MNMELEPEPPEIAEAREILEEALTKIRQGTIPNIAVAALLANYVVVISLANGGAEGARAIVGQIEEEIEAWEAGERPDFLRQ